MWIFVKLDIPGRGNERTRIDNLSPMDTIERVKALIGKELGMKPDGEIVVYHKGRILENGHILQEYGVKQDETLQVFPQPGSEPSLPPIKDPEAMDISPSLGPSSPVAAHRGSRPPLDLPPLASDDDSDGPDVIPGTRLLSPKSTLYSGPRTTPYDDEEYQLLHTLGDSICEECIRWPKRPCTRCGCYVCGGKSNENETLVCDKCEDYYHLGCLDPPLKKLPEEEWYCPRCTPGGGQKMKEKIPDVKPAKKRGGSRKTTVPKSSTSLISARMKVCTIVDPHHFGPIPGVEVGQTWKFRKQCSESGVHRPPMAGISGNTRTGSQSIVISGGYKDDVDDGDTFLYSGSGGREASESGSRIATGQSFDQALTKSNAALAMTMFPTLTDPEELDINGAVADNWRDSRPVRVVRSDKMKYSKYAPAEGFRYDGIYKLFRYWPEKGKDGFIIYRYEFHRDDPAPAPWTSRGAARIKTLGLEMVYPNDWDPDSRKSKGGGSASGSSAGIAVGGGNVGKRKRETASAGGKRMRACYKPPVRLSELIAADTRNAETWARVLAQSPDVIAFVEGFVIEFDCPVCEDFVNNPVTTRCGHNICQECLRKSVELYGLKCPRCWDFLCDINGPEGDSGEDDGKRRKEKKWKQMGGGMRNEEMVEVLRYFNSEYSGGVRAY